MYKIKEGMLSWILHKITGVAVVAYLVIHISSMAKMAKGPEAFNVVIEAYKTLPYRAGEVLLLGAILFHGTNGLRLIIGEFIPRTMEKHKLLVYLTYVLAGALFIVGGLLMWRAEG